MLFRSYAAENFTTNNHGTYARFGLVPPGTSASVPVMDFLYNGLKLYSPNTTSVYTTIQNINQQLTIGASGFAVQPSGMNTTAFQIDPVAGRSYFQTNILPVLGSSVVSISAYPTSSNLVPIASPYAGSVLHLTGPNTGPTILTIDCFDSSAAASFLAPTIAWRRMRGTVDNPLPAQAGDMIGTIIGGGHTGNSSLAFLTAPANQSATIRFYATETSSLTNQGSRIDFVVTPNGSNTNQTLLSLNPTGNTPGLQLPTTGTGIEFSDGSFQTTAFDPLSAVTSVTVGTGLTQTNTVGAVGIDATGVLSVSGTNRSEEHTSELQSH